MLKKLLDKFQRLFYIEETMMNHRNMIRNYDWSVASAIALILKYVHRYF